MITTSELDWYRYLWTVCWPTLACFRCVCRVWSGKLLCTTSSGPKRHVRAFFLCHLSCVPTWTYVHQRSCRGTQGRAATSFIFQLPLTGFHRIGSARCMHAEEGVCVCVWWQRATELDVHWTNVWKITHRSHLASALVYMIKLWKQWQSMKTTLSFVCGCIPMSMHVAYMQLQCTNTVQC